MPKLVDPLARLRQIALALPEAHEVRAWGEPTFRVKNKLFAMYAGPHNHHGAGRPGVWIKAEPGEQELRIRMDPERYFRPPYVGPSGWVGVQLDRGADWAEVAALLAVAWRLAAPPRLRREHAAEAPPQPEPARPAAAAAKSRPSSRVARRRPPK
jgi:hypothetical protein